MREWKIVRSVPMCAEVRNGLDAVKATRKALGKAAVGKRLVGEPAHLLNTDPSTQETEALGAGRSFLRIKGGVLG